MEYIVDTSAWSDERKVLADGCAIIPGMEMFGHICTTRNLHILQPHIHRTSEFVYLANGTQRYFIGEQEYLIRGNQVMVVDANVVHSSGEMPYGRHESLWFRLDVDAFAAQLAVPPQSRDLLRERLTHLSHPILSPKENLFGILHDAFYHLASPDPLQQLRGYAEFLDFMIRLAGCSAPSDTVSPDIRRVLDHIGAQICTNLRLEDLADLAGLSLSGFKQKFRRETGITPREYINLMKIEKAKELLAAGYSVTETAFRLDFSSSSYFSVLFSQMEDMPPGAYRRKMLEKSKSI